MKLLKKGIHAYAVVLLLVIIISISVDTIELVRNFATHESITITSSENELLVVTEKRPLVIKGFNFIRFPPEHLVTQLDLEVTVRDTNWDGEVKVYLIGAKTQEQLFLGTLDGEKEKTVLQVDRKNNLEKAINMLIENNGKGCLKFVKLGNGDVAIEKVKISIDWLYN